MLFAGLRLVRMVKNCDRGLKNVALRLRPQAAFSSPRSQFFAIRTSQPANNKYTAVSTKVVPQKRKSVRDNADWYYG